MFSQIIEPEARPTRRPRIASSSYGSDTPLDIVPSTITASGSRSSGLRRRSPVTAIGQLNGPSLIPSTSIAPHSTPQALTTAHRSPSPAFTLSSHTGPIAEEIVVPGTPPLALYNLQSKPVAIKAYALRQWVKETWKEISFTNISDNVEVLIRGDSIEAMAACVLKLLTLAHDDAGLGSRELQMSGISKCRAVPLRSFLGDYRKLEVTGRPQTDANGNRVTIQLPKSVGAGVERSVWRELLRLLTSNDTHWQTLANYRIPKFSPWQEGETPDALSEWQSYGCACALHILYDAGSPPCPVSPFLILAAILGKELFGTQTYNAVASFDRELADDLSPWFAVKPTQALSVPLSSPLYNLLVRCDCDVSYNNTYQNRVIT
jgi:hypothetical protein